MHIGEAQPAQLPVPTVFALLIVSVNSTISSPALTGCGEPAVYAQIVLMRARPGPPKSRSTVMLPDTPAEPGQSRHDVATLRNATIRLPARQPGVALEG